MDDSNLCYEPMDVDRSGSTTSKMDISFMGSDCETYVVGNDVIDLTATEDDFFNITKVSPGVRPRSKLLIDEAISESKLGGSPPEGASSKIKTKSNIKTYHIKRVPKDKPQPFSYKSILIALCFFCVIVVTFYQVTKMKCANEIDIRRVRKSFTENLFGQEIAANKIIEMLNLKVSSKLLFLYGGTGVGKTYSVSLMLESLWNSANIYHYTMPSFADSFAPELMFGLTVCKTSVVVVDGLSKNDFHIKSHVEKIISKSENLEKNVTVILIYSCDNIGDNFVKKCDHNFLSELQQHFSDINSEKLYVKFEPLSEEHLKKCIEKELGGRKINKQQMQSIMKDFDVSFDGCKGVYTKVKFFSVV